MDNFLFSVQRTENTSMFKRILIPVFSIVLAFVFCSVLFAILGYNPLSIYSEMLKGSFGSLYSIEETLVVSITLMFCALGVSIAFKMLIWNIGAEGQLCMGAFASTYVALYCPWIPDALLLPAIILAGFLGGAIWAIIAILPNALWKVNEIIITLLLNYVAILWVNYLVYGPWRDPKGLNFPLTAMFTKSGRLATFGNTDIHTGLILAVLIASVLYFILKKTTWGYQITVIGESRKSAQYAGMNIRKNILWVMFFSGGLAGLAGMAQVAGITYRLQPDLSGGYGYTAIIIAYLSKFNPLLVILVSILFGGLQNGGFQLQIIGVPAEVVAMTQGALLFFVLGGEFFSRYKIIFGKDRRSEICRSPEQIEEVKPR